MLFATVPAAPPTRKNQRTTSCPAPISAKVPYQRGSRLILSALEWVSITSSFTASEPLNSALNETRQRFRPHTPPRYRRTYSGGRPRLGRSLQSLRPAAIMSRAVKHGVDVERLVNNREEDPVGKAIGENSANVSLAIDHTK